MNEQVKETSLSTTDGCFVGEKMWMVHTCLNLLLCIDLKSAAIVKQYEIPYKEYLKEPLYVAIKLIEKKLWLIPGCARQMVLFDIESEQFDEISIEEKRKEEKMIYFEKFALDAFVFQDWIYIVPSRYHSIYKIHRQTKKVEQCLDLRNYVDGEWQFVSQAREIEDGKIVMTLGGSNCLLLYDCNSNCIEKVNVAIQGNQFFGPRFIYKDGFVYLFTNGDKNSKLMKINIETGTIVHDIDIENKVFGFVEEFGKEVVLDFGGKEGACLYDEELNLKKHVSYNVEDSNNHMITAYPYGIWKNKSEEERIMVNRYSNEILFYHYFEDEPYRVIKINFVPQIESFPILDMNGFMWEEGVVSLDSYLNALIITND